MKKLPAIMLQLSTLSLFILLSIFKNGVTLPNGAPESVCDTLLPFHGGGIEPLKTVSPFSIVPMQNIVEQGSVLRVEIRADPRELTLGGYMIHARTNTSPYKVVGKFARSADGSVKLIDCNGVENTATHASPNDKLDVGLDWQAPSDWKGTVYFIATVAQEYGKFWVGIKSELVTIVERGQGRVSGISTTRRPFHQFAESATVETTPAPARNVDSFYNGCGDTKSCFGIPENCVDEKNCQAAVATVVRGERYFFEMKTFGDTPSYVASALSVDDKMGDDSVIECVPEQGQIKAYSSWTYRVPNFGVTRENVSQSIIQLTEASYTNGQIYCIVERQPLTNVRGNTFDLINNKYNVLIAAGRSNKENSVGYHDIGRDATAQPKALAEIANFSSSSKILLRLHGAFMLIAWIGTASLGILIARYFKQTWVGSSLCGKDIWFSCHQSLMIITFLLTVIGVALIFVEIGGWSQTRNPHAILGIIVTVLCILQPIGALFRPAPSSSNRSIFNWLHWGGGNIAHILAIVAIFFAVKLAKAELPEWFDFILVAFVAFHVLTHLILSVAGCVSDRKNSQRITSFPMNDMNSPRNGMKPAERSQDAPFTSLRRWLLGIYIIVVIVLAIALVVIIVLAPIGKTFEDLATNFQ